MTGFALRSPWYARERAGIGVRVPASYRPVLQMYDDPDFVGRLARDPRDSLKFGDDDLWSYPVPVTPSGEGRLRLATHRLVTTDLRKLYQPLHNRFYAVVVEVFCDQPGLPRAGGHDDIEAGFALRRRVTSFSGGRRPSRQLARTILTEVMTRQKLGSAAGDLDVTTLDDALRSRADCRDIASADEAWRARVREDNAELIAEAGVTVERQGWVVPDGEPGSWQPVAIDALADGEETFPMWRLPPREEDCARARTRSLWFGLVPTHSGEHQADADGRSVPKYDDHSVYEIDCFVRQQPAPGHEHCPPKVWLNQLPTEPFRLASPSDPQGSGKRLTTITLPDLRRLGARAGQPMGPGGVQIVTPPGSGLSFNPFGGIPGAGSGSVGGADQACTFALELFFIVAFFLFLLFLPVVVFAFQLWWMLALRFCLPSAVAFDIAADYFAQGKLLSNWSTDTDVLAAVSPLDPSVAFDQMFGTDSAGLSSQGVWLDLMADTVGPAGSNLGDDPEFMAAALKASDPELATPDVPPELDIKPDDPLRN